MVKKKVIFLAPAALISVLVLCHIARIGGQTGKQELTIGERFHYQTSMTWRGVIGDLFSSRPGKPPQYKRYRESKVVKLPEALPGNMTLEEAVNKRRSVRNYSPESMDISQLSRLLLSAQGVTGKMYGKPLRSVPSAGALYPIEIYCAVNSVQGVPKGIYHYGIESHALELVKEGDFKKRLIKAGLDQEMLGEADVTFLLSAIFNRSRCKYGERAYRYVYMEAGHVSQNIYLQAVSLGLGSVSVGAFLDEQANALAGVDGKREAVIYLHAVGTL